METILIAGGSGSIGTRLTKLLLQKEYRVIVLSRKRSIKDIPALSALQKKYGVLQIARWDTDNRTIDESAISSADYIINLAGAGIAEKRWTPERKEEIVHSRTNACSLIIQALRQYDNKVKAVISASAIGWYGKDSNDITPEGFTESMSAANDFLGSTCQAWEAGIAPVSSLGKRLVILRTGIVLGKTGGAFTEFRKPLNIGIAMIPGSGKQVISWIHEDDICGIYMYALENRQINGVYNAVAPEPVSSRELISEIAQQHRGKIYLPLHIPSFALRWGLGELSGEILKSTTVSCKKITDAGFVFSYPGIAKAVKQLLHQ